jgi:FkbM family methyltransferase
MGKSVARFLLDRGEPVLAFIDQRSASLSEVVGLPCWSVEQAARRPEARTARVVTTLHNPGASVADAQAGLLRHGLPAAWSLHRFCLETGFRPPLGYWLDVDFDWEPRQGEIEQVRALLADSESRRVLDAGLALRRVGDYAGLPQPTIEDQYFARGLRSWRQPLQLLDGGAYDGDTLRGALANGYALGESVAFEPDPANAARLRRYLADEGLNQVSVVEAGVASQDSTALLAVGQGAASRLAEQGYPITLRSIDSIAVERSWCPSLLKLDVEGAELEALVGATQTLLKGRTELVVAAYHRPADLLDLPLHLARAYPGQYQFFLRSHAQNGFDTVLYAQLQG